MILFHKYINLFLSVIIFLLSVNYVCAQSEGLTAAEEQVNTVDVKEIVFSHIGDSYEWHITNIGEKELIVPLPIIVRSKVTCWHFVLASRLHHNDGIYDGLYIAPIASE